MLSAQQRQREMELMQKERDLIMRRDELEKERGRILGEVCFD